METVDVYRQYSQLYSSYAQVHQMCACVNKKQYTMFIFDINSIKMLTT